MIIKFSKKYNLPLEELYSYFDTPADWVRIFGFPGDTKDLGDGWMAVSLKHFPFPLVAKNTEQETGKFVRWIFRGFWRGRGEIKFMQTSGGVEITGYEEICEGRLFFLSPLFERLVFESRFRAIWNVGWHRLSKLEATRAFPAK